MRRLDKHQRIDFRAVQTDSSCPLPSEVALARFHARERDEAIVSGAAAFAAMWRAIPMLRPLGLVARHRLVLAALERAYLYFLRVRPAIQRRLAQS